MKLNKIILFLWALFCLNICTVHAFTSNDDISVTRNMPLEAEPGETVVVEFTVTSDTPGDNIIRGFFISDQIDESLYDYTFFTEILLNGSPMSDYFVELGAIDAVYSHSFPFRVIIENPPDFSEENPIARGDIITLRYEIDIPGNAVPGETVYSFPGYSWAGRITNLNGDLLEDIFGFEDLPQVTVTITTPDRYLTINIIGNGSVTKDPDQATYTHGEQVTITANSDTGYSFDSWSGDATGSVNPLILTMDGDKSITANFSQNQYSLDITAINGSVSKNPDQATYTHGEQVTITATPDTGYSFDSWSGDATGFVNPLILTMDGDKSITANFLLKVTKGDIDLAIKNLKEGVPGVTQDDVKSLINRYMQGK